MLLDVVEDFREVGKLVVETFHRGNSRGLHREARAARLDHFFVAGSQRIARRSGKLLQRPFDFPDVLDILESADRDVYPPRRRRAVSDAHTTSTSAPSLTTAR